jgi:N-acetylglucosamine kinase-like BadF-type ATPase
MVVDVGGVPAGTVVGVDAGGTGSRAVVVRDGEVVERRDLGPLNVILHADAVDRIAALLTGVGATAAGLGLAGLRSGADADRIAALLRDRTGARVAVGDDTDAALAGAFRGGPGIVVIAGTGSGAAGRDAAGRTVRVGGHGYLLGDEGGGYWIGRQAVSAALRAADGTGPPTALTELVRRAFDSLTGAEQQVHSRPTDRGLLARLVPVVTAAAVGRVPPAAGPAPSGTAPAGPGPGPAGDPVAARILDEAAGHLVALATAVRDRLGPLPVAGVGGVFRCAAVAAEFRAATGATDPAEPPELGALRLLDRG